MGSRIYKFGWQIRMKNLYLASKNQGKIAEYKKLLAGVNCKLLLQPESLEVEEDGQTFRDNAIKKASEVSRKTNNFSICLLYTSPSPRDGLLSRMPSSA